MKRMEEAHRNVRNGQKGQKEQRWAGDGPVSGDQRNFAPDTRKMHRGRARPSPDSRVRRADWCRPTSLRPRHATCCKNAHTSKFEQTASSAENSREREQRARTCIVAGSFLLDQRTAVSTQPEAPPAPLQAVEQKITSCLSPACMGRCA